MKDINKAIADMTRANGILKEMSDNWSREYEENHDPYFLGLKVGMEIAQQWIAGYVNEWRD